jgi:4-amino-4-deoxy-L-arabinose transferase-like glycosyltransferase
MSVALDMAFKPVPGRTDGPLVVRSWTPVLVVTAFAAVLRVIFYPGFFGSDEVTYVESAFKVLHGDWSVDSYVGANRYGVNLPVAAFGWLFGQNELAAALYSMLCSLGEVAMVTGVGIRMFGTRAGVMAGLLLACLPVHVHYAGRLMADAPLCLAVTASFVLFYLAELRKSRWAYLGAGCAAGFSFWIKPAAIFYVIVLLCYPLVFRRMNRNWLWTVLGFATVILANNLMFWFLTHRFWFLLEVLGERQLSGYLQEGTSSGAMTDAADYYFVYLFGKVYQTWLVGYLAIATSVWWLAAKRGRDNHSEFSLRFTLWWAAGMLVVMSLLIVSWRPLVFVPKQTNYMLLFVAPLCLLAGVALARLKGVAFGLACVVTIGPALVLGLLQQASVQVFTANSKAVVDFARSHPESQIFVTTNAYRAVQFDSLVHPGASKLVVEPLEQLLNDRSTARGKRLAVIDTETLAWASRESVRRLEDVPPCWEQVSRLAPVGLGWGSALAHSASSVAAAFPGSLSEAIQSRIAHLAAPAPAFVYRVPSHPCGPGAT